MPIDPRTDEPEERKYTLSEAAAEIARRECGAHGHSWDVILNGGKPVVLYCTRCDDPGYVLMRREP